MVEWSAVAISLLSLIATIMSVLYSRRQVRIEAERRHDELQPEVTVSWHYYVGQPRSRQLLNFEFHGPLTYDDVAVELHLGPNHNRAFTFVTEDGERTDYVSLGRIEPGQDADIEVAKVSNYFDAARLQMIFRRGKSIWKLSLNKAIDKDVEDRFTRDLVATGEVDSDAGARRALGLPVGGVHLAIGAEAADRLFAAEDDYEGVMALVEEFESDADVDQCETRRAWGAIHRSLTGGLLGSDKRHDPLNAAILGGRQLHKGDDHIVSYLAPNQVRQVAEALALMCGRNSPTSQTSSAERRTPENMWSLRSTGKEAEAITIGDVPAHWLGELAEAAVVRRGGTAGGLGDGQGLLRRRAPSPLAMPAHGMPAPPDPGPWFRGDFTTA